jgi:ADP-ribosylglycohydrolase
MAVISRAENHIVGSLLGLALGDALGFLVEACEPAVAVAYVRDRLRVGSPAEALLPDTFGQYSDDTQLARELLAAIANAGGWRPEAFAARLAGRFQSGLDVGAGPGSRGAALRIAAGTPWHRAASPAPYAGNGAAMRAGPLGALFAGDQIGLRRVAVEQSRVTHQDRRCAAGAVAIAGAAALAAAPGPLERRRFLETLGVWVAEEDAGLARALASLADWDGLEPDAAAARLHALGLEPARKGPWLGVSSFVTPSVLWSLYAFLRSPDDYWEVICTAIAVGGDTDTTAAMAGALAGARVGPQGLPAPLLERLHDAGRWRAPELAALARRCAAVVSR